MPQDPNDSTQKIMQFQSVEISPETQENLNKPLKLESGPDPKDLEFLGLVTSKIESKEIDLYRPSSLFNTTVYEKLSEESRAKADMDAFNLLATIRDINRLSKAGQSDTYQFQNLVQKCRLTKERLEEVGGDIFII